MEANERPVDGLDALLAERGYSGTDRALVKAFLDLPADVRETVARALVRAAASIVGSVGNDAIPFRIYDRDEWAAAMGFHQKALLFGGLQEDGPEAAGEAVPGKGPGEGQ